MLRTVEGGPLEGAQEEVQLLLRPMHVSRMLRLYPVKGPLTDMHLEHFQRTLVDLLVYPQRIVVFLA